MESWRGVIKYLDEGEIARRQDEVQLRSQQQQEGDAGGSLTAHINIPDRDRIPTSRSNDEPRRPSNAPSASTSTSGFHPGDVSEQSTPRVGDWSQDVSYLGQSLTSVNESTSLDDHWHGQQTSPAPPVRPPPSSQASHLPSRSAPRSPFARNSAVYKSRIASLSSLPGQNIRQPRKSPSLLSVFSPFQQRQPAGGGTTRPNLVQRYSDGVLSVPRGDRASSIPVNDDSTPLLSTSPPSWVVQERQPPEETTSIRRTDDVREPLRDRIGGKPVNGYGAIPVTNTLRAEADTSSSFRLQWTPATQAVLKCSIAYLIASFFTFIPVFAHFLSQTTQTDVSGRVTQRPAYSAHMVATIVVYFHPARSVGSMILADKYCLFLAMLSASVCALAMATISVFDHYLPTRHLFGIRVGELLVLVLWIGAALGGLAWTKQWMNNPSYNTGCSMAAVILFVVIVKEGGWVKLAEILFIVFIGASISNLVCFSMAPSSATSRLQGSITSSLTSFKTLLSLLSATFLLDPSSESQTSLEHAVKSHSDAFTKLKSDLAEAKHESLFDQRIAEAQRERLTAVVESLTRLAQHLNGLRGGIDLQTRLLDQAEAVNAADALLQDGDDGDSADEVSEMSETFLQYKDAVGDAMRSLVKACCESLLDLQGAFRRDQDAPSLAATLQAGGDRIRTKLDEFRNLSLVVIRKLYGASPERRNDIFDGSSVPEEGTGREDDEAEPNEAIFLIYFFVFTLEEYAREQLALNDAMQSLLALDTLTWWESFVNWVKSSRNNQSKPAAGAFRLRDRFTKIIPLDPSDLQPAPFPHKEIKQSANLTFPDRRSLTRSARWFQALWALQDRLQQPDIKYAIKTAVGTIILASPAFIEGWRPIFLEYRGEWGLIAYWASMSMTIGGTNLMLWRVLGTMLGASVAVLFYTIFPDNASVLPLVGFVFSMPCFWIITQRPAYQQAARFVLLTYNLTCLYSYNRRESGIEAYEVGWQRTVSIVIGSCWAGIVSNVVWPYAARKELRVGLSDFCLDLTYLYGRLVKRFSGDRSDFVDHDENDPTARDGDHVVRHFMQMELHLQIQLINLQNLLAQTRNEPRLKGPFPVAVYSDILAACQSIVDRFHSMRCATTRQDWDATILDDFITPVNPQRREMVSNVILYLYILSASLRLRTPLPPILPPAELSRRRLVAKIKTLEVVKRKMARSDQRVLGYSAYTVAMQGVIASLEDIGEEVQALFGVLGEQSREDFERLFA